MMPKKSWFIGGTLLCLLLIIAFWFISRQTDQSDRIVRIGLVAPLTGPAAPYGKNVQNGATLAADEINEAGGIDGKKLELIIEDEGTDPRLAVSAVQKLTTVAGVNLVIGPTTSNGLMAAAPIAERAHVVLLSPGASSDTVSQAGDFVFRNRASASQEAAVLAQYALEDLKSTQFCILAVQAEYGVSFASVFRKVFEKGGGKILVEASFPSGETDFRTHLSKVAAAKGEGVFLVGVPVELGHILKQMREMGIKVGALSNSLESPEIFKIAGPAAEGVIFSTTFYDPEHGDQRMKEFDQRYRRRYGAGSDLFAANAYDAVSLVKGVLAAGASSGVDIRNALYAIKDFPGIAGAITFDSNGDVRARVAIKKISGGAFLFVKEFQQ